MRELKFRFWDKNKNRYEPNCLLAVDELGDLWKIDSTDAIDLTSEKDRYVVEQCTGLKDKNGKDIYEGDVVRDVDGDTAIVIWREYQAEWGIKWIDLGVEDSLSHRMEWGHLNEVIGNIHENPELLGEGGENE